MNIVARIRKETMQFTYRTALVEPDRVITYAELLQRVTTLKQVLTACGIQSGMRIAFRCSDGIDYVIGALALLENDAAVVPITDSVTADEFHDTIRRIDVHGVLTQSSLAQFADEEAGEKIDETFRLSMRRPFGSELDSRCKELGAAFIRFSSGTTGQSKGVVLSHGTILDRTDAANRGLAIDQRDIILWVVGMSHHFVVSILLFLRRGTTIIVANTRFPFSVIEASQRFPITFIYASPVHYYLLTMSDQVSRDTFANVRLAISTSMQMPATIADQFAAKFDFSPAQAYGIIEIGLPFIHTEAGEAGRNTVGRVLPDYQLRIANADAEGVGEVMIRGKGMFDAYFSPWRLREECLQDGWFQTGDLGRLDEDGRLILAGRTKTVIVCAGMKVFPEEVEAVINSMSGVAESLVSAREHPQFGQVPVAAVVIGSDVSDPSLFLQELRAYCLARLSSYKVPIDFIAISALPKTRTGKLMRGTSTPATAI
jgi:long-chain acyl-CoA synthetase